jgi:hypothetical protein
MVPGNCSLLPGHLHAYYCFGHMDRMNRLHEKTSTNSKKPFRRTLPLTDKTTRQKLPHLMRVRNSRKYNTIESTGMMRIDQRYTSSTFAVSLTSVNFMIRIPDTSTMTSVA